MKKYKYIGTFRISSEQSFKLEVYCNGLYEAFFLLTADAIRSGRYFQLDTITDEKGEITKICDIETLDFFA